jgi:hypothetical protein
LLAESPDVPTSEKLEILKRIAAMGVSSATLEEVVGVLCKSSPNDIQFRIEAIGFLKSGAVKLALIGEVFRDAGMSDLPELSALVERYPSEELRRRWLVDLSKHLADAGNVVALKNWFKSTNCDEVYLISGFCERLRQDPNLMKEIPFASVQENFTSSSLEGDVPFAQIYAANCLQRGDRSGLQRVMESCSRDSWYLVLANAIAEMKEVPASFEDDIDAYVQQIPRISDREDVARLIATKRASKNP